MTLGPTEQRQVKFESPSMGVVVAWSYFPLVMVVLDVVVPHGVQDTSSEYFSLMLISLLVWTITGLVLLIQTWAQALQGRILRRFVALPLLGYSSLLGAELASGFASASELTHCPSIERLTRTFHRHRSLFNELEENFLELAEGKTFECTEQRRRLEEQLRTMTPLDILGGLAYLETGHPGLTISMYSSGFSASGYDCGFRFRTDFMHTPREHPHGVARSNRSATYPLTGAWCIYEVRW